MGVQRILRTPYTCIIIVDHQVVRSSPYVFRKPHKNVPLQLTPRLIRELGTLLCNPTANVVFRAEINSTFDISYRHVQFTGARSIGSFSTRITQTHVFRRTLILDLLCSPSITTPISGRA